MSLRPADCPDEPISVHFVLALDFKRVGQRRHVQAVFVDVQLTESCLLAHTTSLPKLRRRTELPRTEGVRPVDLTVVNPLRSCTRSHR